MKFEKVSFETFAKAVCDLPGMIYMADSELHRLYDNIHIPQRSTEKSAGYDFFSPISENLYSLSLRHETVVDFESGDSVEKPFSIDRCEVLIPTGIKAQIDPGWVLTLCPRSGQGFKYGIALANTVGIIDEDYYNNPKNEGHIMVKLTTTSTEFASFDIEEGMAFCQGIFLPYGLTDDDAEFEKNKRTGGLGSTGGV